MLGSFLVLGPSQSGKSSFINSLAGKKLTEVGKGDGTSVTSLVSKYCFHSPVLDQKIELIDLPGFCDSRLKVSDKEIQLMIKNSIMECLQNDVEFKGFIVVESIRNDVSKLNLSLERLFNVAGVNSKPSILVLINKIDYLNVVDPGMYNNAITICQSQNLFHSIWTNSETYGDQEWRKTLIDWLVYNLKALKPYKGNLITEIDTEISNIATSLYNAKKTYTKDDIINKAKELASKAPKVLVNKIEIFKEKKIKTVKRKEIRKNRDNSGDSRVVKFTQDEEYYEDYQVPYQDYESPPFEAFLVIAQDQLQNVPFENYLKEAKKILGEKIKKMIIIDR